MRPQRNTERILTNAGVERLVEKERALGADIALRSRRSLFADHERRRDGGRRRVLRHGVSARQARRTRSRLAWPD
jgi:hypothetical protein